MAAGALARQARLLVLLGGLGVAAIFFLGGRLSPGAARGAILGIGLATAGAAAGLSLTAWSFGKRESQFFGALVIGILARLLVYGGTLVYVALRTALDPVATAGTLLAFYLMYLVLEVRFAVVGLRRRA